jgi:hypothetical protein
MRCLSTVKPIGWLALALALACCAAPAGAQRTANSRGEFIAAGRGDALQSRTLGIAPLIGHKGANTPFLADGEWVVEYLADPASIYSELKPVLRSGSYEASAGFREPFPRSRFVNRVIAWDLGLDKALPFHLYWNWSTPPEFGLTTGNQAAQIYKAGVPAAIYRQAQRLSGAELSTLGAELAVAASVLSEWLVLERSNPQSGSNGLRPDVFRRFENATSLADLSEQDLAYLADILRYELSVAHSGFNFFTVERPLPTPLRIARVAAARHVDHSDLAACLADGAHDPVKAGTLPEDLSHPICMADANDRAVYRWYRTQRAAELARPEGDFEDFDQAARLIHYFDDVRGAWANAYADEALDWSNHAEVVEAQIAATITPATLDAPTLDGFFERANALICTGKNP